MNKKVSFIFHNFAEFILSIPKTVYFNFKVLPFASAIRFPFVVSYHIKLKGVNRKSFIVKNKKLPFASQRIGFEGSAVGRRESKRGLIFNRNGGKIILLGSIGLSRGIIIDNNGGTITLGNHFRCNYSGTITCDHASITIGDEVVCGWNVTIKNGDGHTIIENGQRKPRYSDITIGNHVWLCSHCDVLKGTHIGDNCVVAYRSMVTKTEDGSNLLYAGSPAKVIRTNINWEE